MNKHNLKVGQRVFIPDLRRNGVTEYEISKIGRKWVEYKWPDERYQHVVGRFDIETLFNGTHTVWLSLEELGQSRLLSAEWNSFRSAVNIAFQRPKTATLESIKEARRLLGL